MEIGDDSKHPQQQCCSEWSFHDVPSDITLEVSGETFALHKLPLVSRSGRIRKLVAEHRQSDLYEFEFLDLPGGAESFKLAAKFCYGLSFEITPANVAQLCCVSDYLGMHEEYFNQNLGARAEEYLDTVVCKNPEMCVEVLKQCESLLPLADELRIVNRCIDTIVSKASVEQIAVNCEGDWRIEDLAVLRIDLYERVITAMKCRGVRPESIGASLVNYAQELTQWSSSWNLSEISRDSALAGSIAHERLIVETIVSLLPVERLVVLTSFLFGLLRCAVAFDCSASCSAVLERRIGSQLDTANLDDLLISSVDGDTVYDVDMVHRILYYFSQQDEREDESEDEDEDESEDESESHSSSQTAMFKVSKLVDEYLAEIARDADLKLSKFMAIAESVPPHARTVHDQLYQAIDEYLMTHQGLSKKGRRSPCKLIDFQKLSGEGGAQAEVAMNECLPLQPIVQGLF